MPRRSGLMVGIFALVLAVSALSRQPLLAASPTAGDEASLKAAITAANASANADTILLTANITLTTVSESNATYGATGLPAINHPLTIEGQGFTITRSGTAPNFRIFRVASGASLTLYNLKVTGGAATNTARCPDSLPAIPCGGAIYNEGTFITLHAFIGSSTASGGFGGGLFNARSATATLTDSTFDANSADEGGGAFNKGSLTVTDSVFSNNTSVMNGGGLESETGTATVTGSNFFQNSGRNGGGIDATSGTMNINRSALHHNTAQLGGGGLSTIANSTTVSNTTISNNTSNGPTNEGGGGLANYGTTTIINTTISDNSNPSAGDIEIGNFLNIYNTIVAYGNGINGPDCHYIASAEAFGSQADDGTCPNIPTSVSLNLDVQADNGGNTPTLNILPGSSAIGAGNNSFCSNAPVNNVDQRGVSRSGSCDIGALEAGGVIPTVQFAAASSNTLSNVGTFPVMLTLDSALSAGDAPIVVYVWVSGGTSQAGTDYIPFGVQTVTFNPGDTTKTVNLSPLNSATIFPHSVILSIASQNGPGFGGPAQLGTQLTHTVLITPTSPPNAVPARNYYTTSTPTLTWANVPGATSYEIQVDTDTAFLAPYAMPDTTVSADTLDLQTDPLDNGTYYWRVRAYLSNGTTSAWSPVESFTISS